MATASILINGGAPPLVNGTIGASLTLSNSNDAGVISWSWEIVDKPTGSTATLATPTASTTTVTLDKEGSYLFRLTINGGEARATAVAAVPSLLSDIRMPAAYEVFEVDSTRGWTPAVNDAIMKLEDDILKGGIVIAQSAAAITAGQVVRVAGLSGLANGDSVPSVEPCFATVESNLPALGVAENSVGGASQRVRVRISGLCGQTIDTSTSAVGNPIYVSDAGAMSLTAGTITSIIGYVDSVGVNGRVVIVPNLSVGSATRPGLISTTDRTTINSVANGTYVEVAGDTMTGALTIDPATDVVGLVVDAIGGQTNKIVQIKVAGAEKASIDKDGYISTIGVRDTAGTDRVYMQDTGASGLMGDMADLVGNVGVLFGNTTSFTPAINRYVAQFYRDAFSTEVASINTFGGLTSKAGTGNTALYAIGTLATSGVTTQDSPSIVLRSYYWTGVTSQAYDASITHDITSTTPNSKLSFAFNGTEKASIDKDGSYTGHDVTGRNFTTSGNIRPSVDQGASVGNSSLRFLEMFAVNYRGTNFVDLGTGNFRVRMPDNSSTSVIGRPPDGGTAVAVVLNAGVPLTVSGSKIASFQNDSVEKASIDYAGNIATSGGVIASYGQIVSLYTASSNTTFNGPRGNANDGATAVAVKIGNLVALNTAGAKIVSFYNDNLTTEKAHINKDGAYTVVGAASGGTALSIPEGSRIYMNGSTATHYIDDVSSTIRIVGAAFSVPSFNFTVNGAGVNAGRYVGLSNDALTLVGSMVDGASAIAVRIAANADYVTAGAKLLSVGDNIGATYSEKAYIDKDGKGRFSGGIEFGDGTIQSTAATTSVTVQDEGVSQGTTSTLNFTGTGVTASISGGTATINVPSYTPSITAGRTTRVETDYTLAASTSIQFPFNSANINENGGFTASAAQFTSPVDGAYYNVMVTMTAVAASAGATLTLNIRKNSVSELITQHVLSDTFARSISLCGVVAANGNDVIDVYVQETAGIEITFPLGKQQFSVQYTR